MFSSTQNPFSSYKQYQIDSLDLYYTFTIPFTVKSIDEEIWSKVQLSETAAQWNFHQFPYLISRVNSREFVNLVTELSQKVVGSNSRDDFIRTTLFL